MIKKTVFSQTVLSKKKKELLLQNRIVQLCLSNRSYYGVIKKDKRQADRQMDLCMNEFDGKIYRQMQ